MPGEHPFDLPLFKDGLELELTAPITFLVGENGSGKSTLLEAIAWAAGFGAQGGNRDQSYAEGAEGHALGRALRLAWRQRVAGGFFLRAETLFNFATYLEQVGSTFRAYGGKSLHQQSHGEAFLTFFRDRFVPNGTYFLDEPEAPLSPFRQLAFLALVREAVDAGCQIVMATHSPILLACPDAAIWSFDEAPIRQVAWRDLEHVSLTRDFLNDPDAFLRHL